MYLRTVPPVLAAILGVAALAVAADPPPAAPATPIPAKGHLPAHFKALGLSADQKAKIETIVGAAAAKVHELQAEIDAVREKEKADYMALLTPAQVKLLAESVTGTTTPPTDKALSPATPETKKP